MQKRWAPAASAALACSRIWSGSIIACIGGAAWAYRGWAQNPQSSAQPPDLALTSEHMSVESPKRSWRTSQARSTNPPISSWSVRAPRSSASSKLINGGMHQIYERVRTTRLRPALLRQPARWPLVPGEVLDDLRIAGEPPSEDEDLEV